MAADITAKASTPGARKSMGSLVPVGKMSTKLKNTSSITGIPRVSNSCSLLRIVACSSARS